MIRIIGFFLLTFFFVNITSLRAEEKEPPALKFGTKAYMAYEAVYPEKGKDYNSFQIRRAYLTMKAKLSSFLSFRMTLDVYNDDDGVESRMKYLYADFHLPDFSIFTKPHLEFGIAHTPWLDFEEHINWYRMQGTMFLEREQLFNSADFGFTIGSYLGGLVDEKYQKEVSKKYPGKYGSLAVGVYDGGGYHNFEQNNNKIVQGRLTLRPLPNIVPGLQFSYLGIYGKGNNEEIESKFHPDWKTNVGMISYEHKYFTVAGQFVAGSGNKKGNMIDIFYTTNGEEEVIDSVRNKDYRGFSLFTEIKVYGPWRLIGRYDNFTPDTELHDDMVNTRLICGIGYDFGHHNIFIIDFDKYKSELKPEKNATALKATMQISF